MNATIEDLRAALQQTADEAPWLDSAATTASVSGRIAASRRRRVGAAVALGAVAIAAGFAVLSTGVDRAAEPANPTQRLRTVAEDPNFPAYEIGLKRLSITEWAIGPPWRISLKPPPGDERLTYVRAYCTDIQSAGSVLLRVRYGPRTSDLMCAPPDSPWNAPLRLDPGAGISLDGFTVEAVTPDAVGTAHVAVYQETPWPPAVKPTRPADFDTAPPTTWPSLLYMAPGRIIGPRDPSAPNVPLTFTKQYEDNLTISLIARGPGVLRATVNGRAASFKCHDDPEQLVHCPASEELGRSIEVWGYGAAAHTYISDGLPEHATRGDLLTLRIYPSGFTGDDWRVSVFTWTPESGATGAELP